MSYKFFKETTSTYKTEYRVPLHTYVLDDNKHCVGYIKEDEKSIRFFNQPMKTFSKKNRTFKNVTKKYS
jgi:hypothetical protein